MGFPGTINELAVLVAEASDFDDEFMVSLARDQRSGVQKIHKRLLKELEEQERERERFAKLLLWERKLSGVGRLVAGVDEVGRGPLAGPVVAGAVIWSPKVMIPGLKDSKKLTPKQRERLTVLIKEKAIAWALGQATAAEVDRYNVHQAGFMAMRRAVNNLEVRPDCLLVDGWAIPHCELPQTPLTGGDNLSVSIAAASIIAKTYRDRLMDELHVMYPLYGFAGNKGYPTPEHYAALAVYGPTPIHRYSFKGVGTGQHLKAK